MKIKYLIFYVFLIGALFGACEYNPVEIPEAPESVSFVNDVEPIFTDAGCVSSSCHGGNQVPDLRPGNAYESLVPAYTDLNSDVNILTVPDPNGGHPKKYSAEQKVIVEAWLNDGAPNN